MIKKLIFFVLIAGLAYVGYLVWNNLTPKEKEVVSKKASSVVDGAKKLAGKAADKLTGVAKDEIKKMDDKDKNSVQQKPDAKVDTTTEQRIEPPASETKAEAVPH